MPSARLVHTALGVPMKDPGTPGFKVDPMRFFQDELAAQAATWLAGYAKSYTGRYFERLALHENNDRDRVNPYDFAAVSTLSVQVPPEAVIALMEPRLAHEVHMYLRRIPDGPIWDSDIPLGPGSPADLLWKMMESLKGMGRTITSKLMAAKRPALFPIYDSVVAEMLYVSEKVNTWELWRARLMGPEGEAMRAAVTKVIDLAESVDGGLRFGRPSILRAIDIVVWRAGKDGMNLADERHPSVQEDGYLSPSG